jgi:PAS domain S-box-containing protein
MTEHPAESAYPRSQAAQLPPSMSAEILGSMKDGVIAVGRDGHILLMNPVAEQLFGIPAAMAVGQSFGEIFLIEEGLDEFNDHMLSAIYNPGVAQTIDLTLTTAGVQKHLVVRTSRLPAEHFREVEGMVAVIADDSERVLRLRERVELERVRAAAGRFIIAVMTIFSVFTLSLEPMQKLAINSGLDLGVYAALIAMMVAAFGIKWWTGIPAKSLGLLEGAVGRSSGCVPRGAERGTTRRNSDSIPTSCNEAQRRAGRALAAVALFTRRVMSDWRRNSRPVRCLHER